MHFKDEGSAVRITAIDISIAELTKLFLKVAVALIPALLILSIAWIVIGMLFMMLFAPLLHSISVDLL